MPTFVDFWTVYPRRKGSNARALAELKFKKAIQQGADPAHIISSARKYADESREQGLIDTPFVCMASTWLNQRRYLDYAPDSADHNAKIDADMAKRGYVWNGEKWVFEKDTYKGIIGDA